MKTFRRFVSCLAPLLAASFMAAAPQLANAQPKNARYAPQVTSFQVEASDQLTPGSDLDFTLEGTPRGQASVRLSGVNRNIVLRETERGIYEGSYTLSRRDKLGTRPTARATLRVKNSSTTVTQALSGSVTPPVATTPPATGPLAIERFLVTPVAKIEPGAELRFATVGTPGGRASFSIDGVVRDVPMTEVRPGRYEGAYTIRRNDNFPPSLNIVSSLVANGQTTTSKLNQALLVDARPPTIRNLAPQNNETVPLGPVSVSATFDDRGGMGVDPKTVKILISGQDVTRAASITPQFLTWRGELRQGTHQVEVTASDIAGNAVRQNWVFNIASAQAPAIVTALPLEVTSHANNAQVSSGAITVRGRTAPGAKVDIQTQVVASLAGLFGINQPVGNQSVTADAAGNFSFSINSQLPIPGARYESTITATKGDQKRETQLVLFQQR
ncbi:MAG TPA: hypothetical protein VE934_11410 [Polaromonas sp.]|uniref:Ig-like domain-containing protein n=1 Tax=Polaromonas sp. TaxID=1869339 RepID=UPI002D41F8B7|nr:hypothetical protein [Polaromonas sp.]HYW57561.1 hypothetical protein [Polaromonas sp.]